MKIIKLLKSLKKYIILIFVFSFIQVIAELLLPTIMSKVVDEGIVLKETSLVTEYSIYMILMSILCIISVILVVYFTTKFASTLTYKLRSMLYKKIISLSKSDIDTFGASTLTTRCTNDVNHVTDMFSFGFRIILFAPIMGIGAIIMALITDSSLSYVIVISVLILIFAISIIFILVYKKFELIQVLIDKLNSKTREILYGQKVIRSFNKESYFEKKFDSVNEENKKLNLFVNKILFLCNPIILIVVNFASIFVILASLYGTNDVYSIEVGKIMAFIQYMAMILMSFTIILLILILVPRTLVSLKRIEEVLETNNSINDTGKRNLEKIKKIEFKNVSYKYKNAEEETIKNISFVLKENKYYGLIGSSGSGKTTIINLLLRHIEPTSGTILINDLDIKEYSISSLRENIGCVSQKALLFKGSIKENLIYDKNVKQEKINKALKDACIYDFVKEKGLDYELEQLGSNLSGGQKQRLTIARTLLKNSSLYIFDDSFSAVDYITDKKIRENISKEVKNKMVFIVTQRIGTIKNSDEIIVLEDGKIEGIGDYKYLSKNSKVFKEFIKTQEKEEENE